MYTIFIFGHIFCLGRESIPPGNNAARLGVAAKVPTPLAKCHGALSVFSTITGMSIVYREEKQTMGFLGFLDSCDVVILVGDR